MNHLKTYAMKKPSFTIPVFFFMLILFCGCSSDSENGCDTCKSEGETIELCDDGNGGVIITGENFDATLEDSSVKRAKSLFCD